MSFEWLDENGVIALTGPERYGRLLAGGWISPTRTVKGYEGRPLFRRDLIELRLAEDRRIVPDRPPAVVKKGMARSTPSPSSPRPGPPSPRPGGRREMTCTCDLPEPDDGGISPETLARLDRLVDQIEYAVRSGSLGGPPRRTAGRASAVLRPTGKTVGKEVSPAVAYRWADFVRTFALLTGLEV
jgi:hypothetical protein